MPRKLKTTRNCRICNSGERMCPYHQRAELMELQEKVFRLKRAGYTRAEISKKLNISEQTVKRHVRYYRKATGGLLPEDVPDDD